MRYHLYRRPNKKTGAFWMDLRVNDCRYREPLGTSDRSEAHELMLRRIEQLKTKAPDPTKRSKSFGSMDIPTAIEAYILQRKAQVSPRMVDYWRESAGSLSKLITIKLKAITPAHISAYQNARLEQGKAPKTINGELSVLRQLLKHGRLWDRFKEDYKTIRNDKPPVGRALTNEEQARLFEVAQSREDWLNAYTAGVLGAFCGMRGVEIRHLQWKDIDLAAGVLHIRRSKTPSGWRSPSLNTICKQALNALRVKATLAGFDASDHFLFPAYVKDKEDPGKRKLDPTQPAKGWRSAWRSVRKKAATNDQDDVIYPNLLTVRFHDTRHCAVTAMAEAGLPDQVIMAQVGHISPEMMKHYSHIRRQALNAAAAALEPSFMKAHPEPIAVELVN
jgi:integrase